ncbi:MAG: hypothetical protein PHF50_03955 [Patescibacteria group bacterium]|nr:hypothetical protein [Patescibacteria group bacterium]
MKESLIFSPENDKIFTDKQKKAMERGARELEKSESIRSGRLCEPCPIPGPEEYGSINKETKKTSANEDHLRPRTKLYRRPATKGYGWLDVWEKQQEKNNKTLI